MKTFQITQNFGGGSLGFIYFDINSDNINVISQEAINVQQKDYADRMTGLFGKATEKPTIKIKEYSREDKGVVKSGISFSTKWR